MSLMRFFRLPAIAPNLGLWALRSMSCVPLPESTVGEATAVSDSSPTKSLLPCQQVQSWSRGSLYVSRCLFPWPEWWWLLGRQPHQLCVSPSAGGSAGRMWRGNNYGPWAVGVWGCQFRSWNAAPCARHWMQDSKPWVPCDDKLQRRSEG